MAKLTSKGRKSMPQSEFALPGKRFPVEDKPHARNAKARASEGVNKGTLSATEKSTVDRRADAVLRKGKKK